MTQSSIDSAAPAAPPSAPPPSPPAPQPAAPPHTLEMRIRVGRVCSAAAVLLLVMSALDSLIGDVLDQDGRSWPAMRLMGLGTGSSDGWQATFPRFSTERTWWLVAFIVTDLLFIFLYYFAAQRSSRVWPALKKAVAFLFVADISEDVLALVAALWHQPPTLLVIGVRGATIAKTVAFLVAFFLVVFRLATRASTRAKVWPWVRATSRQAFSLLAVVPLAVLSVLPGNDLLDQLPDVQRRWLLADETAESFWNQPGLHHAAAAVIAVALVAVSLLVMGRLRSATAFARAAEPVGDAQRANLWLALVGPAIVVAALVVILIRNGFDQPLAGLLRWPFLAFVGLPVGIALVSLWIRSLHATRANAPTYWANKWFPKPRWRPASDAEKARIVRAGDLIATWAIVIAALGLVRSYTPVLALAPDNPRSGAGGALVGFLTGVVVAIGAWPAMRWVTSALTTDPDSLSSSSSSPAATTTLGKVRAILTPSTASTPNTRLRLAVLGFGVALIVLLGLNPTWFADQAGVIASATLALLAACLVVGGLVALLETRLAPELFWFWPSSLRPSYRSTTPVTGIMLAAIVATWTLGGTADVHGVRGLQAAGLPSYTTVPQRPTIAEVFTAWEAATAGCAHEVPVAGAGEVSSVTVRPMFLVAAEGGGIRAAYWAAASMDLLSGSAVVDRTNKFVAWGKGAPSACARPLFATGASGGSVGLTVARFAGQSSARAGILSMAAPDALGVATVGMFVRDLVYGATGLPLFGRPEYVAGSPNAEVWSDRAALMQDVWSKGTQLGSAFLPANQTDASTSTTGALILNSTRVSDGCRAWVSQVDLQSPVGAGCDAPTAPSGHTIDLLAQLWQKPTQDGQLCLGSMTAATAAMLTARFPFVTPSGVAGPCGSDPDEQQFVDGGYVENSGIKTIVDLAPAWLTQVQQHNTDAMRTPKPDLIVPVVVYLDNGTGSDLVTDPPAPTPELLVPQRTKGRATSALVDTPSLLGDAEAQVAGTSILPGSDNRIGAVRTAVDGWRQHKVFLIRQSTFPAVTAPLGWVLSQHSLETMDRALYEQAVEETATDGSATVATRGSLGGVLRLIRPAK